MSGNANAMNSFKSDAETIALAADPTKAEPAAFSACAQNPLVIAELMSLAQAYGVNVSDSEAIEKSFSSWAESNMMTVMSMFSQAYSDLEAENYTAFGTTVGQFLGDADLSA